MGDVVLATSLAETLHKEYPYAYIDFLVRSGNESLLLNHPFIRSVLVFDKNSGKLANMLSMTSRIRKNKYDLVVNAHRFGTSGFMAARSGGRIIRGFDRNPFSVFFTKRITHLISSDPHHPLHEIDRNHQLIADLVQGKPQLPQLYPSSTDFEKIQPYISNVPYSCIAPASIWFTKQLPISKWKELITLLPANEKVYLIGGKGDESICQELVTQFQEKAISLAGKLTLLQTTALLKSSRMNFVNDSGPLHLASSVNAPIRAFFCSTLPSFGFGPLSTNSKIIEARIALTCKPCGLHGKTGCPKNHFHCATEINMAEALN